MSHTGVTGVDLDVSGEKDEAAGEKRRVSPWSEQVSAGAIPIGAHLVVISKHGSGWSETNVRLADLVDNDGEKAQSFAAGK